MGCTDLDLVQAKKQFFFIFFSVEKARGCSEYWQQWLTKGPHQLIPLICQWCVCEEGARDLVLYTNVKVKFMLFKLLKLGIENPNSQRKKKKNNCRSFISLSNVCNPIHLQLQHSFVCLLSLFLNIWKERKKRIQ